MRKPLGNHEGIRACLNKGHSKGEGFSALDLPFFTAVEHALLVTAGSLPCIIHVNMLYIMRLNSQLLHYYLLGPEREQTIQRNKPNQMKSARTNLRPNKVTK